MAIYFYSKAETYFEFSNFSAHPFELDGLRWPTVEHYFQAQKFPGTPHAETIRQAPTPGQAKRLGRSREVVIRSDWEQTKEDVMRRALEQKFRSHPKLHRMLLDTGDEQLVENAARDYYWGCGRTGSGQNRLGELLMELRTKLSQEPGPAPGTPLNFYSVSDEYGEFSNFARFPIRLKGKMWPTSEHYFQAQKFAGTPHEEQLRRAKSAMKVAKMGRERSRPLRRDWESVKDNIMREAVWAKFSQHEELTALLLSTGDRKIVEHTTNDAYWGDGGGKGRNMLGTILMEVRAKLRGQAD